MNIFKSEDELLSTLESYTQLVIDCVLGHLSFQRFLVQYNNFYMAFALDGHESDIEEQSLLTKYENRIALHREIWESILSAGLCSDEDAVKDEYIKAGRFGSSEGTKRLKVIARKYDVS